MDVRVINDRHNPRVEQYALQRLNLIVGRFEERLSSIDVRIRDLNAEKGIDKSCSIDACLIPRGKLHVQAKERDVYEAVLTAIHRLETVVSKTVDCGDCAKTVRHSNGGPRPDTDQVSVQADETS